MNADELALWAEKQPQLGAQPALPCSSKAPTTLCLPTTDRAPPTPGSPTAALTKRDELSFRRVLALPKASMAGLASMI